MSMHERHTTFPSASEAFVLALCLWGIEYLVFGAVYDARKWIGIDDSYSLGALAVLLANGILFTALLHWKRLSYRDLFNSSRNSTTATIVLLVPPILLATPFLLLVMGGLNELLQSAYPMSASDEEQFGTMLTPALPQLVLVCVLAPVLEEMLFRGIILRSFLVQYERWYAIAGSAVVFGFAHGNLYQFVGASLFGLFAGWLYERTRSLVPSIALHAAINTGTMALAANADADVPDALTWIAFALPAMLSCFVLRRWLGAPTRS